MRLRRLLAVSLAVLLIAAVAGSTLANPGLRLDARGNAPVADLNKGAAAEQRLEVAVDADGNKLFDNLEARLKGAANSDPFDVIIMFDRPMSDAAYAALEKSVGAFAPKFKYEHIFPGMAASLTKAQILALQKNPLVKQVEYDLPVQATMGTASTWFGAAKARQDFGLDGDRDGTLTSYSKNDIVIAIIDTGIATGHVDLDGGKVIGWKDLVNNKTAPYDDNGHGTHVASITAGTGEGNATYKGVAYGAALVGIKVLDRRGSGSLSTVDAGIEWAIANKATYGIRAINLSLGTSASSDGTDSTSVAVNKAVDNGIVALVAAGNSGPARYTIGSPGAAEKAITVGAMSDVGHLGFNLASFSSRGPTADNRIKPDVASPGYKITAADYKTTNGYVEYSGTSMATPFTAGVAALMLDANPNLTPLDVKSILASTARDWGPAGKEIDYGSGRLDAYEAVKAAGNFTGTGPVVPLHYYGSATLTGTGDFDDWLLDVTTISMPLAVTLIIPNWVAGIIGGSPDFDLYVYDPAGALVGSAEGTARQETITISLTKTGAYKIRVKSYSGSGDYFFDVSANQ